MTGLEVTTRWDEGTCILALRGEARLETVQRFDTATLEVLEAGARDVLIDLTHLAFMDSASAGALVRLHGQVEKRGGSLVLFGLQRVIQRMIDHSGLQERLHCAADEAAAREIIAST